MICCWNDSFDAEFKSDNFVIQLHCRFGAYQILFCSLNNFWNIWDIIFSWVFQLYQIPGRHGTIYGKWNINAKLERKIIVLLVKESEMAQKKLQNTGKQSSWITQGVDSVEWCPMPSTQLKSGISFQNEVESLISNTVSFWFIDWPLLWFGTSCIYIHIPWWALAALHSTWIFLNF